MSLDNENIMKMLEIMKDNHIKMLEIIQECSSNKKANTRENEEKEPEPSIPEPSIPEPSIHIDKKSTHSNRWITHVKEFAKIHNISYKEALSKARLTYK